MNVQVLADPLGRLIWASPARPAPFTSDRRPCPRHVDALVDARVDCFADKGYQGAGGTTIVLFRGKRQNLSHVSEPSTPPANRPSPPSRLADTAEAALQHHSLHRTCPSHPDTPLRHGVIKLENAY